MKKHVLFDFDGVIGDTAELNWEIVQELHNGVTKEQYLIQHHLGNVFEHPSIPFTKETSNKYAETYNLLLSEEHIRNALPSLCSLGKEYVLHVVSSNCEVAIRGVLARSQVEQYFGLILGKEAHASKVEKFNRLFAEEGFGSDETVYVTDTLGDLIEATKVGLPTVAVTFGYHPITLLTRGKPTIIAQSWTEVEVAVRNLVS